MVTESSLNKDILEMLQKIPVGDKVSIKEISTWTGKDHATIYLHIGTMENVGVVYVERGGREKRVRLLRRENTEELLSFIKTCQEFGLTDVDVKILESGEEDPVKINEKTKILLNVVGLHKEYIKKKAGASTLWEARTKIFGETRIPAYS